MRDTHAVIESLSNRIERAYLRTRPGSPAPGSTPGVWAVAASGLLGAHRADPSLPLDPELFVASQSAKQRRPEPWRDLVGSDPLDAYRRRVRRIVRSLRKELSAEVAHADQKVWEGEALPRVLTREDRRLSDLGRYIVALKYGRKALAGRFVAGLFEQLDSCPLYRQAAQDLLPEGRSLPSAAEAPRPVAPVAPLGAASVQWN